MKQDSIIEENPAKEYARKMNILDSQIAELELDIKEAKEMLEEEHSDEEAELIEERIDELHDEIYKLEKKKRSLKDLGIPEK